MSFVPLPRLVFPTPSPLFSDYEHPVNKAFTEVEFATRAEVFGERPLLNAPSRFSPPRKLPIISASPNHEAPDGCIYQ